jgi:hypothetical protein
MLKFEIRNIIVDEEILGEVHLKLVHNIGVDTVKMREIKMQEKIRFICPNISMNALFNFFNANGIPLIYQNV